MSDINNALILMGVGMCGIFLVMIVISVIVRILTKITK